MNFITECVLMSAAKVGVMPDTMARISQKFSVVESSRNGREINNDYIVIGLIAGMIFGALKELSRKDLQVDRWQMLVDTFEGSCVGMSIGTLVAIIE